MKKLIILTFLLAIIAGSFDASAKVRKKNVIGDWKYEAPTAPYGFETGILAFFEKEGKLDGELKLADGYKISLEDVKLEKNVLSFGLYVEGGYVTVNTKIEGESLSGTVDTPDGELKLTAKKIKKA